MSQPNLTQAICKRNLAGYREAEHTQNFNTTRKINPTKGVMTGDNTPNDLDRVEIGPTKLAFDEWAKAELELPDLQKMRRFRHQRLVQSINARDYGALLVFDPLNIHFATDSTNMQLGTPTTHSAP